MLFQDRKDAYDVSDRRQVRDGITNKIITQTAFSDGSTDVSTRTWVDDIGLYRDVWIAAIASYTTSLATRTAAICVRFQGRRVRRVYVTMQITFLTRKCALIYRRGLRQRVASLTLNCGIRHVTVPIATRILIANVRHIGLSNICVINLVYFKMQV